MKALFYFSTCFVFTFFVGIAISPMALTAQHAYYRLEPVSLENGVSHQFTNCIHQDREGFLWFGTMFGLIKYDGYTYTTYRSNPMDSTSLANDDVMTIYEDREGDLWIGTYRGGLHKWDRSHERFTRFLRDPNDSTSLSDNTVLSICEDSSGMPWVGTNNGLNCLNKSTGQFARFQHDPADPNSLSHNTVHALCADSSGTLWVGTLHGLDQLDRGQQRFIHRRHDPADSASLSHDRVKAILQDHTGTLWIGTQGGLNRFIREQNRFVRYQHDPANSASLSGDAVNTIYDDQDGRLWIGTVRGLNQYDRDRDAFVRFLEPNSDFTITGSGAITAICRDEADLMWVGTYHSGIYKLLLDSRKFVHHCAGDPKANGLSHGYIQALCEDRTGKIWIGTVAGLNRYDESEHRYTLYALPSEKSHPVSGRIVNAIYEDRFGYLWVGTRSGLNRFEPEHTRARLHRRDPKQPGELKSDFVTAFCEDREGALWIGTAAGLHRYDYDTESFTHFTPPLEETNDWSQNHVLSLHPDREGTLWIGTYAGLLRLDVTRPTFTRFRHDPSDPLSLSNDYCFALGEDQSGNLWIGTGGGLNRFDRKTETFTSYNVTDGLPNSVICGLMADDRGMLWLSTHKGLSRFDPLMQESTNFELSDGLQSNMFIAGAYGKRRNGELLFGGINGFSRFHPDSLKRNLHVPRVAITSCKVFDQPRRLQGYASTGQTLKLAYHENFFSFEFAALDFVQPEKNQYAYRLEAFDADWIYSGTRRYASYTNLAPGDYVFHVKAANNDGVWNEQGASLRITITPPFWQTAWFLSTCALALGLTLLVLHNYRVRARLDRFQALEQARRLESERVRKKAANDFHDELGHRLTKIALFSELVKSKLNGSSTEVATYLDKISDDSQRLTTETRDFIWSLDPAKDSVYEVILYLKDFADELFDRTDIEFRLLGLTPELQQIKLTADAKRHLTLIFKEGLTNALKHAVCRHVILEAKLETGRLQFVLRDDGTGSNGHSNGTRRGLNSMKERAQKMQADLLVVSQADEGTRVVLTMKV